MASFTETATLRVVDESSKQIRKINSELKKLMRTAQSLKSASATIDIKAKGLAQATSMVKGLQRDLKGLKAAAGTINVKANTSSASAAIRKLHAQAQQPARMNVTARGTGRAAGALSGRSGAIPIMGTVNIGNIGAIASALGRATKEGYKQTDTADTKLALAQLEPKKKTAVEEAVRAQQTEPSATGPFFNRAQRQDLLTEALGSTGGDVAAASYLVRQAESLAKVGMGMGQSFEQARTGATSFIKAGEQMGQMSDAAGKFDYAKAERYFDTMRKATMQVGQEFTGQAWRTTVQSAGQAKTALDEKGILTLALASEEQGSRAGVGLNEAIKNLSTQRLDKKKIAYAERLGLVTSEQMKTGTMGGKSVTEIFGKGATDEGELRRNILDTVINKIIPTMEKQGIDINDPSQVSKFAGKITSGKGTDFLTGLILRAQELQRDIAQAQGRKGDISTTDRLLAQSGQITGQGVKNQFQGALGELANKAESAALPLMKSMAENMSKASEQIRDGKLDPSTALKGAMSAAGGGLALGVISGLQALTSKDPGVAALGGAATALTTAAGSGILGKLGDLLGGTAAGGAAAEAARQAAKRGTPERDVLFNKAPKLPTHENQRSDADKRFGRMGEQQRGIGSGVALLAAAEALKWAIDNITPEKTAAAEVERKRVVGDLSDEATFLITGKRPTADDNALTAAMKALTKTAQAREDLQQRVALSARSSPDGQPTVEAMRFQPQIDSFTKQMTEQISKLPWPKAPYDQPGKFPEGGAAPITHLPELTAGVGQIKNVFDAAPSRFTEAFSVIPGQMTAGGQQAGTSIASAMVGAAGQAGAIIANAISSAAANVQVNVATPAGRKADTGSTDMVR